MEPTSNSAAGPSTNPSRTPSTHSMSGTTLAGAERSRMASVSNSFENGKTEKQPVSELNPNLNPTSTSAEKSDDSPLRDGHIIQKMPTKDVVDALKREVTRSYPGGSPYPGKGTEEEPYLVDWLPGEQANPYNWSNTYKWVFTAQAALVTLCIAFASSCYTGAALFIEEAFHVSEEIVILGVSLYVLGFAAGPLLWAPLGEMRGRREPFLISYFIFAIFHLGGALAQNIETIIITRFFAGFFGSSMLTNSGGMVADVWSAKERGLATALFAMAPFLGPVLGPIVGGFAGQSYLGWRSVFYIMLIFSFVMLIAGYFILPESYAPILVRRRAQELQTASSKDGGPVIYHIGKYDLNKKTPMEIIKIGLSRPFQLLFLEPIVLLLSIYTSIVYGVLYLFFTAFPIVFQTPKPAGYGFGAGTGGLAFCGIGVGMVIGTALTPISNKIYLKAAAESPTGRAPPEARLPMACFGACLLPAGLIAFAWTGQPHIHWIVPIIMSVPFGTGMILVFTSIIGYLIDSYLLFAASALAANAVLRSLMGAAFPLFSTQMYHNLGNPIAGTVIAALAFACVPMPFVFYKYGAVIRQKSRFAPTGPPPGAAPTPPAAAAATNEKPELQRRPTLKERQPSEESALEPEWGPEAGAHAGLQEDNSAPIEMQGRKDKITGENAV